VGFSGVFVRQGWSVRRGTLQRAIRYLYLNRRTGRSRHVCEREFWSRRRKEGRNDKKYKYGGFLGRRLNTWNGVIGIFGRRPYCESFSEAARLLHDHCLCSFVVLSPSPEHRRDGYAFWVGSTATMHMSPSYFEEKNLGVESRKRKKGGHEGGFIRCGRGDSWTS
jgi:hypothetical protein